MHFLGDTIKIEEPKGYLHRTTPHLMTFIVSSLGPGPFMAMNAAQAVCNAQVVQQVIGTLSDATADQQADIQETVANVSRLKVQLQKSIE